MSATIESRGKAWVFLMARPGFCILDHSGGPRTGVKACHSLADLDFSFIYMSFFLLAFDLFPYKHFEGVICEIHLLCYRYCEFAHVSSAEILWVVAHSIAEMLSEWHFWGRIPVSDRTHRSPKLKVRRHSEILEALRLVAHIAYTFRSPQFRSPQFRSSAVPQFRSPRFRNSQSAVRIKAYRQFRVIDYIFSFCSNWYRKTLK